MTGIQAFEEWAREYDRWFDLHRFAYESELQALRRFIPERGRGLEVGVGTGRFAGPLGVRVGVEPARAMAALARERGVEVHEAVAEELPMASESFDFVLMVTALCFFADPARALREATRVLRPGGRIVIGMIDRDSPLGRVYTARQAESRFYRQARFQSIDRILEWLHNLGYQRVETGQTLFGNPETLATVEPVREGHGEGGFAVVSACKAPVEKD